MPRQSERGSGGGETPKFPETTPPTYRGSDYSFTLQAVMETQKAVGALTEAVKVLQQSSNKHDDRLSEIGKDVHTVKITARLIGAVLAGALAFAGWSLGKAVDVFVKLYQPAIQQQQVTPRSVEPK